MESGSSISRNSETRRKNHSARAASGSGESGGANGTARATARLERIPEGVRASAVSRRGEYDARRLRSQREIIRDVMLAAADCDTWLTLGELRALTRYGEASISAQLRHLRKLENGAYEVVKRHREDAGPARAGTDGRGECVWEYRVAQSVCGKDVAASHGGQNISVKSQV